MRYRKIILILFLTFFGLVCFISPTRAETKTKILYPSGDTYTDSFIPDDNYGSSTFLFVGDVLGGWCRSYLQFEKSKLPSNIQKVYLRIQIIYISNTLLLDIYTTDEQWDEYGTTHNNRPGAYLFAYISIPNSGQATIGLPDIDFPTVFPTGSYITFMLTSLDNEYFYFASNEHTNFDPALLVDYTVTESNLPLIIGLVVGIGAAIGVGAIGAFLYIKKKKARVESIQKDVGKPEKMKPVTPTEIFCGYCGANVTTAPGKFCPKCGRTIP